MSKDNDYVDGKNYDELNWTPIPSYDGWYEINAEGQVRSWKNRNHSNRAKTPSMMRLIFTNGAGAYTLSPKRNKIINAKVSHLMAITFMGGIPEGMTVYHLNGNTRDNRVCNLKIGTPEEAYAHINKVEKNRRCVFKVGKNGEILEVYKTATEAAKKNFVSLPTVIEHCRKKIKNPFKYLDFTFCYDRGVT